MIEVREAVEAAEEFARDAYSGDELNFLRLEEIELDSAEENWKVTLGWVTAEDYQHSKQSMATIIGQSSKLPRTYKTFDVDAETGEVTSMKIRDV